MSWTLLLATAVLQSNGDVVPIGRWFETGEIDQEGCRVTLDVREAEPLTLCFESWDADVWLRISDPVTGWNQTIEGGGAGGDVRWAWTPEQAGRYEVVLGAERTAYGEFSFFASRGTMPPIDLTEEQLASRWEMSLLRANEDEERKFEVRRQLELLGVAADDPIHTARMSAANNARKFLSKAEERMENGGVIEARTLLRDALKALESAPARPSDSLIGYLRMSLGLAAQHVHDATLACEILVPLLPIAEADLDPLHQDLQWLRSRASVSLLDAGRYQEAKELLQKTFEVRSRTLPANEPVLGITQNYLGFAHMLLGDHAMAELNFRSALRIAKNNPDTDVETLTGFRLSLGDALERIGDFDRGREQRDQALADLGLEGGVDLDRLNDIALSLGGWQDPSLPIAILSDQGYAELRAEKAENAIRLLNAALHLGRELELPEEFPTMLAARWRLAQAHGATGNAPAALKLLEEVPFELWGPALRTMALRLAYQLYRGEGNHDLALSTRDDIVAEIDIRLATAERLSGRSARESVNELRRLLSFLLADAVDAGLESAPTFARIETASPDYSSETEARVETW